MKTMTKTTSKTTRRRKVMDDTCLQCGARMVKMQGPLMLPVHGDKITVPDIEHWRCKKCGDTVTDFANTKRLMDGAHALYREKHDLLSGEEIRAIRQRRRLTPEALASLLHLRLPHVVGRWEEGRAVQSVRDDLLLRLLRDLPGVATIMKKRAA